MKIRGRNGLKGDWRRGDSVEILASKKINHDDGCTRDNHLRGDRTMGMETSQHEEDIEHSSVMEKAKTKEKGIREYLKKNDEQHQEKQEQCKRGRGVRGGIHGQQGSKFNLGLWNDDSKSIISPIATTTADQMNDTINMHLFSRGQVRRGRGFCRGIRGGDRVCIEHLPTPSSSSCGSSSRSLSNSSMSSVNVHFRSFCEINTSLCNTQGSFPSLNNSPHTDAFQAPCSSGVTLSNEHEKYQQNLQTRQNNTLLLDNDGNFNNYFVCQEHPLSSPCVSLNQEARENISPSFSFMSNSNMVASSAVHDTSYLFYPSAVIVPSQETVGHSLPSPTIQPPHSLAPPSYLGKDVPRRHQRPLPPPPYFGVKAPQFTFPSYFCPPNPATFSHSFWGSPLIPPPSLPHSSSSLPRSNLDSTLFLAGPRPPFPPPPSKMLGFPSPPKAALALFPSLYITIPPPPHNSVHTLSPVSSGVPQFQNNTSLTNSLLAFPLQSSFQGASAFVECPSFISLNSTRAGAPTSSFADASEDGLNCSSMAVMSSSFTANTVTVGGDWNRGNFAGLGSVSGVGTDADLTMGNIHPHLQNLSEPSGAFDVGEEEKGIALAVATVSLIALQPQTSVTIGPTFAPTAHEGVDGGKGKNKRTSTKHQKITFASLGLNEALQRAVADLEYEAPWRIQRKVIKQVLKGNDIVAGANRGSGKCAAYSLPLLQLLHSEERSLRSAQFLYEKDTKTLHNGIKVLILTASRENAAQVEQELNDYSKYLIHPVLRSVAIYGGINLYKHVDKVIKGKKGIPDVLISTPGRLWDMLKQEFVCFNHVRYLVLDETDRMLETFSEPLMGLLAVLPVKKQTIIFADTLTFPAVKRLADSLLRESYKKVQVTPRRSEAYSVKQYYYLVGRDCKIDALYHIISSQNWSQVLVFTRTKHRANDAAEGLKEKGITAVSMHGGKSQMARIATLADFRSGVLRVLVATEVAAKEIDVDCIHYVVNYDIPNVLEDYVQRVQRAGQEGTEGGTAVCLSTLDEEGWMNRIREIADVKIGEGMPLQFVPAKDEIAQPIAFGLTAMWGAVGPCPPSTVMATAAREAKLNNIKEQRELKEKLRRDQKAISARLKETNRLKKLAAAVLVEALVGEVEKPS